MQPHVGTNRTGLSGEAAAFYSGDNVISINPFSRFKRLTNDQAKNRTCKINVLVTTIDGDFSVAGFDPDAGD